MLSVQLVEVAATEFSVGRAMAEQVPRGDEGRVAHGHDGFLVASAARDPVVLRGQIAVPRPDRPPRTFDQRGAQPAVAFGGFARLALPGTLVVARADARPGGGVHRRG